MRKKICTILPAYAPTLIALLYVGRLLGVDTGMMVFDRLSNLVIFIVLSLAGPARG